jgi:hypothetical protein
VSGHGRKKAGRKPPDGKLPGEDKIINIEETKKQCACGSPLTCFGEDMIERLVIIPERVYVVRVSGHPQSGGYGSRL